MHAKVQVSLNQPRRQIRASLILLFGKTKALFGSTLPGKILRFNFIAYIICGKRNRNQRAEIGGMFSMKSKATCKKLSSFRQVKKKTVKKVTYAVYAGVPSILC